MNAHEIAATVSARRHQPREIVRDALDRIAAAKALNAVVTIDTDASLAEAAKIDRRLQLGETMPLAGVPIVIKDNIWVDGWRVTQGSRLFADFVAPRDAIAVERLKKAGAVVVGMGATSEFACKGVTTSPLFGPTRHPLDRDLTPGGSSGGPATAVAAGPCTAGDRHGRRRLQPAPSGPCRRGRLQAIVWRHSIWSGVRRAVLRHIRDRAHRRDVADAALAFESHGWPRSP